MSSFFQARSAVPLFAVIFAVAGVQFPTVLLCTEIASQHGPLHLASEKLQPALSLGLGVLKPDLRHTFRIPVVNSSSKTLYIHSVTSSCGCSSLKIESGTIPPGEFTELLVDVATSQNNGEASFAVTVKSSDSATGEPRAVESPEGIVANVDEFRFYAYVRNECTILPSRPILRPSVDYSAAPYRMRIVNYSNAAWLNPSIQFSEIDVPFSVEEDRLVIDEQMRQVLHVTIDRHELSRRLSGTVPWPSTINLRVTCDKEGEPDGSHLLAERVLSLVRERSVEIHPKRVRLTNSSNSRITLILVSKSKQAITPTDIVVRADNVSESLDVHVETIGSDWLKIHVQLPFGDATDSPDDMPRSLTVDVPKLHFSQNVPIVLPN